MSAETLDHPPLAHVLWLGGSPDSGKTSIAQSITERHGLNIYHFDRHEADHFARADPLQHPALYAAHPDRMTTEQRWLGTTPDDMARDTIRSWSERFTMAVEDIRALPVSPPILAEGPGFFPNCVAPYLTDPGSALWLVPAPAFKRASALRRNKPGNRWETSDPERAQHNLIERDLRMGAYIVRTATALGLTVFTIDGSRDLAAMTDRVDSYFAPRLTRLPG